jgi:hypothetical protein
VNPTLSPSSVELIADLLGNVQLPVTHPQLEELAAAWGQAKRELAAINAWHTSTQEVTP